MTDFKKREKVTHNPTTWTQKLFIFVYLHLVSAHIFVFSRVAVMAFKQFECYLFHLLSMFVVLHNLCNDQA